MSFVHGKATVTKTTKGLVRGYKKDDVYHFCGIPYAEAKRFMMPHDVESWEGVREATNYGFTCPPFLPDTTGNTLKSPHRFWINNENCQNLNVWTKSIEEGVKKPVLVWFHGGGFSNGSALDLYAFDGKNICDKGDVVVVNINHRLNVLGYLDLSAFGEEYAHSANVGNWDLIWALKWVKDNIGFFGGDRDNVTIFGQSGGGGKTISVMNMPYSAGLYHKAMVMSGVTTNLLSHKSLPAEDIVRRMLENLGSNDVRILSAITQRELADNYLRAFKELGGERMPFLGPTANQDYIGDPFDVGFTEYAKSVPMIVGSNFSEFVNLPPQYHRSEMSDEEMVVALEKEFGRKVADQVIPEFLKSFPDKKPLDLLQYDAVTFRKGTKAFVKKRIAEGCAPTYEYLFAPTIHINDGSMPQHNSDISYFYYNTDLVPSNDIGEATKELERNMSERLVNFARRNDPQSDGNVIWPASTAEVEKTIIFDVNTRVIDNFDDGFIEEIGNSGYYKPLF